MHLCLCPKSKSNAKWPSQEDKGYYEPYVVDGILDELMMGSRESILGVRIVLESIEVHPVDSNGYAFY